MLSLVAVLTGTSLVGSPSTASPPAPAATRLSSAHKSGQKSAFRRPHAGSRRKQPTSAQLSLKSKSQSNDGTALAIQALQLHKRGQVDQAVVLATRAVQLNARDAMSQAVLSYLSWQQGNVIDSVDAGERAVALAPTNAIFVCNLAALHELFDDCAKAIPLYERARKANPDSWVAQLGLTRCYMKTGNEKLARETLAAMSQKASKSFDWYYEVSDMHLQLDEPRQAVAAANLACLLASTPEQKAKGLRQQFLCLLRDNQPDQARALQDTVLVQQKPDDYELYVRALSAFAAASDPAEGKTIVDLALANLTDSDDNLGFFKLGRVCQAKALEVSGDATKYGAWLNLASSAYGKAAALYPRIGKYHIAAGSVLAGQGKLSEAKQALDTALKLEPLNGFVPYMAAHLEPGQDLKLRRVPFTVCGLHCGCHVNKLNQALSRMPGVAFSDMIAKEPYQGTLLVDQSVTNVDELLRKGIEQAGADMKLPVTGVTATAGGTTPVSTLQDAVVTALNAEEGSPLHFATFFKPVQPEAPSSPDLLTAATKSTKL